MTKSVRLALFESRRTAIHAATAAIAVIQPGGEAIKLMNALT
jgi:hypothetical protein